MQTYQLEIQHQTGSLLQSGPLTAAQTADVVLRALQRLEGLAEADRLAVRLVVRPLEAGRGTLEAGEDAEKPASAEDQDPLAAFASEEGARA